VCSYGCAAPINTPSLLVGEKQALTICRVAGEFHPSRSGLPERTAVASYSRGADNPDSC